MSEVIIRAENLGKSYRIAHAAPQERYTALRDVLARQARQAWSRLRRPFHRGPTDSPNGTEEFWALRDVSFEIKRGEAVGIIGRNGAGKSTLLKILSRITEPTTGRVTLRGRVASLLEVGTGFHPELTGRENIYLNGAILGMTRAEITRKFDEIVDFAGVEKFLDTPVKRYSSGMYVRLAFAVAAHLEPEILVVDEVLAVGDAEFQKKCLGKMEDVASHGRTVLFVSHNMGAIEALCARGILLEQGLLSLSSNVRETIAAYLRSLERDAETPIPVRCIRNGIGRVRLQKVEIRGIIDETPGPPATGRPARIHFYFDRSVADLVCSFTIYDVRGQPIIHLSSSTDRRSHDRRSLKPYALTCTIDELFLLPGRYRINVALHIGGELQDHIEGACLFDVEEGLHPLTAASLGNSYGSVWFPHHWQRSPV